MRLQSARLPESAQAKLSYFITNYLLLALGGFAPYKVKNLFCVEDAISTTLRAHVAYKLTCTGGNTCNVRGKKLTSDNGQELARFPTPERIRLAKLYASRKSMLYAFQSLTRPPPRLSN